MLNLLGFAQNRSNVVDEVVCVVGDAPILLSEVEDYISEAKAAQMTLANPYCTALEEIAIQKLYLHQAELDSVEVSEADITTQTNEMVDYYVSMYGSKENFEAAQHKTVAQFRELIKRSRRDAYMRQSVQRKLTENVKATPAEVRDYFKNVPQDSLPKIPTQVEVEIITNMPQPTKDEVDRVQAKLRDYAERVNKGETQFSTLARFYSEDPGSAANGGEMDYMGRMEFVPEFSNVAFNLTEPGKVSKVVKTEFGYHLIQLVDRKGDKAKFRHILLKPQIPDSVYQASLTRLDSISADVRANKFSFGEAAQTLSDDKDTRRNNGLMFTKIEGYGTPTSRIEVSKLNPFIASVVDTLQVGQISKSFIMINERGQKVTAVVRLKNRIEAHPASMSEDFQVLSDAVLEKRKAEVVNKWVQSKIKNTYVRIKPEWRNCQFKNEGWLK